MGVGRRMGKKQGMPEPLTDQQISKLRRKAGLPPEERAPAPDNKRKRKGGIKANGSAAKKVKTNPNQLPVTTRTATTAKPFKAETPAAPKTNGKAKTRVQQLPLDDDDDDDDDVGDAERLSDLEDGAFGLKDDFLESDSEVYDSEAEPEGRAIFSEDEDGLEAEERLTAANIEGLTRKLDEQLEEAEAEAHAEMVAGLQTNIDGEDAPHILDDDDDDDANKPKAGLAPDLQVLRNRITENIRVLENFKSLAATGRSRSEYTAQMLKDVCSYYGYSEYLAEKLYGLFSPREAFEFFEANETPRPVVIRTNTLRTNRRDLAQALINRGVTLEPVGKWSKVGLQIFESSVPLGATPEYLAGHYILQAASSFLPCMALDPHEGERVLDMAAAPGGKTTYLSAMMRNTGVIIANDPNKDRARSIVANAQRLGCSNIIVTNYDAREIPRLMKGFDRVLLDAPCSGTGVISKDPAVKTNRGHLDMVRLPNIQKLLLLAAIDATRVGGSIVYSTCSVAIEENESVVLYALKRCPNVRLVDSGLAFGKEGFVRHSGKIFPPSMRLARRVYPHSHNMDGFFVAKFVKTDHAPPPADKSVLDGVVDKTPIVDEERQEEDDFGGFDDEEDSKYIDKVRRNAMRRKGINPKAGESRKKKTGVSS